MSFLQAAYEILKQAGEPLSPSEVTSKALAQKLIFTIGKTPPATMNSALHVDIKKKGDRSRFVKVDRGKYGLREWSTLAVTSAPQSLSFKDAAYEVLKTEKRPMSADEITQIALQRGLLMTSGKTPAATMYTELYRDIKSHRDRSFFVQLGKNKFGLREWDLEVIEGEIDKTRSETVLPVNERKRSIVGDPINFEGLIYGPLNENGVIFLFSKVHDKLNYKIEAIQASFPDAKGRRKTPKGWEDVWIEFEFKSSHFKTHNHDPKGCDIIVCWEHDWKACPIEVIELKKEIDRLTRR